MIDVVYIVGMTHSGSTLLDLLISGHSRVTSVGEAHSFSRRSRQPKACTCSAGTVKDCTFWGAIDARMRSGSGVALDDLELHEGSDASFRRHNLAFYEAVREITGRSVIVDSSKNYKRLERMLGLDGIRVRPIHLLRNPHGVVYSHVKLGRSWVRCSLSYARKTRLTTKLLRRVEHAVVRYEDLADDPAGVLSDLMPRLGLGFEEQQLRWAGRERHNCDGNPMRHSRDSSIALDRGWETGLTAFQKAGVRILATPAPLVSLNPRRVPLRRRETSHARS